MTVRELSQAEKMEKYSRLFYGDKPVEQYGIGYFQPDALDTQADLDKETQAFIDEVGSMVPELDPVTEHN